MNVVSISFFAFVIFANQDELIFANIRYEAKEKVSEVVSRLRHMPALPSSSEGFTTADERLLQDRVAQVFADSSRQFALFRKDSLLLASSPAFQLPSDAPGEAIRAQILRDQAGADYVLKSDFGKNFLHFYIPLDEFGLDGQTALITMRTDSVNLYFNKLFSSILFIFIALSLAHLLFAAILNNMVVKPIVKLTKAAENIAEGDYNHVADSSRDDEMGQLAESFNLMTTKIRDQIDKLHYQNEQLNEATKKLHEMAITDELTGLYNRHHLHSSLAPTLLTAERYNRPLGLLLLDVDHFKRVNDTYGHSVGDLVLKHIADILKHTVRQSDLVARYGGEEMIVVLPETDMKGAVITAEKIRVIIANTPIQTGAPEPLRVSVSIGVAEYHLLKQEQERSPEIRDLINAADEALYRAKENGRNRVVVHEPLQQQE